MKIWKKNISKTTIYSKNFKSFSIDLFDSNDFIDIITEKKGKLIIKTLKKMTTKTSNEKMEWVTLLLSIFTEVSSVTSNLPTEISGSKEVKDLLINTAKELNKELFSVETQLLLPLEEKKIEKKEQPVVETKVVTHPASKEKEEEKKEEEQIIDPSELLKEGINIIYNDIKVKKDISKIDHEALKKEIVDIYISFGHEKNVFVTNEKDRQIVYDEMYNEALLLAKKDKLEGTEEPVGQTTVENTTEVVTTENTSETTTSETTTTVVESDDIGNEMQNILDEHENTEENSTTITENTAGPEDDVPEEYNYTDDNTLFEFSEDTAINEEGLANCTSIEDLTALIGKEFSKGGMNEDNRKEARKKILSVVQTYHRNNKKIIFKGAPAKEGVIDNVVSNTLANLYKAVKKAS